MNQTKYTFLLPAYKPDFFEEALRSIKHRLFQISRCWCQTTARHTIRRLFFWSGVFVHPRTISPVPARGLIKNRVLALVCVEAYRRNV